ncbi:NAD(P)-binding domain-containing protein [Asticcacaulis sp. AND118]|uniref:NAD(P)-binding domain-containing protein n=1 Tax=Asticcacaulis sp. AND118 TaxID=2840468 RepID=UPI001CFFE179|nr:NAD(P)/FAD-dependent oxidoreductase [Asticcacaulis sp. AND118]UDF04932.1 NAD(P)/FAD-dependent oxidoreductase [Asticcacaulis sp. AND118]
MSLETHNARVRHDLDCLNYPGSDWLSATPHPDGHVHDVIIVGGGQSGLGAAFALKRERVNNILILDECAEGFEGPWETYARMVTLRTPKAITSIDMGVPSLTFRAWWEAQHGAEGWARVDKIPRGDWMNYLRWYRRVLDLPVINEVRIDRIEPLPEGGFRLHAGTRSWQTRKVVLATGIQGGGEWHTPDLIKALPRHLYAHTSEAIDIDALKGKRVGILGGGASAFDNAHHILEAGAGEAHVFVRRSELPRINPIRHMEAAGLIPRFSALGDADKYAAMSHFFNFNQPPTNDTFSRAAAFEGFRLHTGAPWQSVRDEGGRAVVTTPGGEHVFDFLIVSTGLITDPALRPELREVEPGIVRWRDVYDAPADVKNALLDAHPYLGAGFAFTGRSPEWQAKLHGLFAFNYSALINFGLSASALSGLKYALPKLAGAVADQLFLDRSAACLDAYFAYDEPEFIGNWRAS